MKPRVMIILGSASDINIAQKSINVLEELKIPYDLKVASAHRTHEKVKQIAIQSTKQGVEVFIGIAGLAAHLQGIIAAHTHRPVIGVPVDVKLGGLDALFASVQMPFPAPVASVGVDRGENGALLAAQIIGIHDSEVRERISKYRSHFYKKLEVDELKIQSDMDGEYYCPNKIEIPEIIKKEFPKSSNPNKIPDVAIIPGSYSDMKIAKKTTMYLDRVGISYDMNIISPIRYPESFEEYMRDMNEVKVFITISGLSAHVTGAVVALTEKPVIGVPNPQKLNGFDTLLSMINMPPGVPIGAVGIGNGGNAGVLASEMLGIGSEEIGQRVKDLKAQYEDHSR
jgi:5-(carboxyamino)imidazole ribonucleotide mutase